MYRPKRVSNFGTQGIALVKFTEDKRSVLVKFTDENNEKKFKISRKNTPKGLFPGKWYLSVNREGDAITAYRPVVGNFSGQVVRFAAREGEKPAPKTVNVLPREKGQKGYSYEAFTVIIRITSPKEYAGIEVPLFLHYNFLEAEEDGASVVGFMSKGRHTDMLVEFTEVAGAWERGPMKWSDNILPALEKRILRAAKTFSFVMKNGFIETVYAEDALELEEEEEEEKEETTAEEVEEKAVEDEVVEDDVLEEDEDDEDDEDDDDLPF